jgi:hypothetical protein
MPVLRSNCMSGMIGVGPRSQASVALDNGAFSRKIN